MDSKNQQRLNSHEKVFLYALVLLGCSVLQCSITSLPFWAPYPEPFYWPLLSNYYTLPLLTAGFGTIVLVGWFMVNLKLRQGRRWYLVLFTPIFVVSTFGLALGTLFAYAFWWPHPFDSLKVDRHIYYLTEQSDIDLEFTSLVLYRCHQSQWNCRKVADYSWNMFGPSHEYVRQHRLRLNSDGSAILLVNDSELDEHVWYQIE